jgi:hypothetical protein
LDNLDQRLAELLSVLQKNEPEFRMYVLSDHGMTSVVQKFDMWNYLEKNGFCLGLDYLAFINSTVVSLWYEKGNRREIVHCLNDSGFGRILSDKEREQYHLEFSSRQYGDDLFVANEGVEFLPNFLSLAWKQNMGMHGYFPECSSTRAFLIGSRQLDFVPIDVVDFYDIMVAMLTS